LRRGPRTREFNVLRSLASRERKAFWSRPKRSTVPTAAVYCWRQAGEKGLGYPRQEEILPIDQECVADIREVIEKFNQEIRPLIASGEYYFICDELMKIVSSLESISNCIPLFDDVRIFLSFVAIRLRCLHELIQKFCFKEDMDKKEQERLILSALQGIDERIGELNDFFNAHG
jgi:hypothetical protein